MFPLTSTYAETDKVDSRIGITDQYDASLDLSVFDRLCPLMNIIITRDISNVQFRYLLIKHQKNIILHLVISGWGGTPVEPNVPNIAQTYGYLKSLLMEGFDPSHIVFRIDPIIPTEAGLELLQKMLNPLTDFPVTRLRYKILTQNDNVVNRQSWFQACFFVGNPYYSEKHQKVFYGAPEWLRKRIYAILDKYAWKFSIESCDRYDTSDNPHNLACISHRDFRALGYMEVDVKFTYTNKSRCHCPTNRVSLQKPTITQCPLRCTHCRKQTLNI